MTGQTVKILLIEDSDAEARLIREALSDVEGAEFELEHVWTLREGLSRLAEGGIAAVLLDLTLPDSEGLDTVTAFLAGSADTPVVVLTGLYDEEMGISAVKEGAQDYLVKSEANGEAIWQAVQFAIERSQKAK